MFMLHITQTPDVIERLRTRGPQVIEALTQKMTLLMLKLQSKIVGETIPAFFENGAPRIASTVRAIPAVQEGTKITGAVEAGGPATTKETLGGPNAGRLVDYAAVQEEGVYHSWKIEPVFYSSNFAIALSQKSRVLSVNGLPKALAFLLNGKLMIVRSVTHPGLSQRPFMRYGLQESEDAIVAGLSQTLTELLS